MNILGLISQLIGIKTLRLTETKEQLESNWMPKWRNGVHNIVQTQKQGDKQNINNIHKF